MKFVIANYSYNQSTESVYFYKLINSIPNFSCSLWNMREKSAYDILDEVSPDFLIITHNSLTIDTIAYLAENRNIKLILNISDIKNDELDYLYKVTEKYKIDIKLLYTNNYNNVNKNNKIIYIAQGADIFLGGNKLNYIIDYGLFYHFPNSILNSSFEAYENSSYHVLSNNNNIKNVDILIPSFQLPDIVKCYDNFIFKDMPAKFIPQTFFDSILYGNNVKAKSIDEKILKTFKQDPNNMTKEDLKNLVVEKHTCINRLKTLFSQLSLDNNTNQYIENMIEEFKEKIK